MKSRFNKTCITSGASEKLAPSKGIGKLSDNPKLKELLEKYGNQKNEQDEKTKEIKGSNDAINNKAD